MEGGREKGGGGGGVEGNRTGEGDIRGHHNDINVHVAAALSASHYSSEEMWINTPRPGVQGWIEQGEERGGEKVL